MNGRLSRTPVPMEHTPPKMLKALFRFRIIKLSRPDMYLFFYIVIVATGFGPHWTGCGKLLWPPSLHD